jgi:adenosylmethionine-8-amino-7-oxononanoate aminotransferase
MPGSLNHSFFCDSGSVAVEVAMKMAVQFWMNRGEPARKRFVALRHSYHGDTSGAMSVCDPDDSMHRHFRGFLLEQYPRELPIDEAGWRSFEEFLGQVGGQCAGVIVEPLVQCATGMRFHSPDQLRRLAELTREAGLLFIADEIGTGLWRTGKRLACDWAGVVPDILCLGKSLTGRAPDGRDDGDHGGLCGLLQRASRPRADARAHLHGQSALLRRGQRVARPL